MAGRASSIEQELFNTRFELYRLRKADKKAAIDKSKENNRGQGKFGASNRDIKDSTRPGSNRKSGGAQQSPRSPSMDEVGSPSPTKGLNIEKTMEKEDLLRQIIDLETEVLELKSALSTCECGRSRNKGGSPLLTSHIDDARKRERKAFQTLAAHDAALIGKLEQKISSLEAQRDSVKGIVDEVSRKAALYVEQIDDKEQLLREQTATLDLLQRELERVKLRNEELEEARMGTDVSRAEEAEKLGLGLEVDAMSNVEMNGGDDGDGIDSIPSPNFLDVTGPGPVATSVKKKNPYAAVALDDPAVGGVERLVPMTHATAQMGHTRGSRASEGATTHTHHSEEGGKGEDEDEDEEVGAVLGALSPSLVSQLSPGSTERMLQTLQQQLKTAVDRKESERVKYLRQQLRYKDDLLAEQEKSFENLVVRAQETTLLEAQEIARLESQLQAVQEELRKTRRGFKMQEKSLASLKRDKRILEDLLIDNEAAAVNQAMEALQSTGQKSRKRDGSQGKRVLPRPAITPGALSAQDMIEVLRADGDTTTDGGDGDELIPGWGKFNPSGNGDDQGVTVPPASSGTAESCGDNGSGEQVLAWPMMPGEKQQRTASSSGEGGLSGSGGEHESKLRVAELMVQEKNAELLDYRAREEELLDTLGGVLRKYNALEKRMRFDRDSAKRNKGMRY